ncbi:glutaconyl-CoA decarboxylase subunit gamma [Oxobacter pfennigii]|uniref:Glutaconyl-CoA decarboxylase subunit gamma n=1 Tax=Oxobacter pfennigii TaxID=36849 RepID=A0A0N8NSR2_9CLOT|nr:biotin/lipoyl-containing protein [Oxobacter pfennigii]KPU42744.1 glutaconyl-CoA decarboxylase subunit gamma [Oxobacter pfennigii]
MRKFNIKVNGKAYEVEVEEVSGSMNSIREAIHPQAALSSEIAANIIEIPKMEDKAAPAVTAAPPAQVTDKAGQSIKSPMPGTILSVNVNSGDLVSKGQVIFILEAMKMENEIMAPTAGKIAEIKVSKGSSVNAGDTLAIIQ